MEALRKVNHIQRIINNLYDYSDIEIKQFLNLKQNLICDKRCKSNYILTLQDLYNIDVNG